MEPDGETKIGDSQADVDPNVNPEETTYPNTLDREPALVGKPTPETYRRLIDNMPPEEKAALRSALGVTTPEPDASGDVNPAPRIVQSRTPTGLPQQLPNYAPPEGIAPAASVTAVAPDTEIGELKARLMFEGEGFIAAEGPAIVAVLIHVVNELWHKARGH